MADSNDLGVFLRARRELSNPADAGVPDSGRRQVPGLRREELAMLAGISADYYTRLEQGRDQHPSVQVLDALAHALDLDDDATTHLHDLAAPLPRRRRAPRRPERVDPPVAALIRAWPSTPAYVLGRCWDVLAANPLATALHPGYTVGTNLLRTIFLDPAARDFYLDWDRLTTNAAAALRASAGTDLHDPRLAELVGELSLGSDRFRRLWARHDVRAKTHLTKRLQHPIVGELEFQFTALTVTAVPGQQLVVYHAEPDSPTAQAVALLASLQPCDPGPTHRAKPAGQADVAQQQQLPR